MFNLQGSEIVIVLLLALVVLGPEKLPDAMRKMGQFYAELKKMSTGFQSEFKAAIDEPMREMRDTANVLRDSADFTKLKNGERDEKPKSAEMPPISDADPEPTETDEGIDSVAATAAATDEPALAADSKPAPFSGQSSAAPRRIPATTSDDSADDPIDAADPGAPPSGASANEPEPAADSKPAPFSGRSSAAPRPTPAASPSDDSVDSVEAQDGEPGALEDADEPTAADQPADADDASGHAR